MILVFLVRKECNHARPEVRKHCRFRPIVHGSLYVRLLWPGGVLPGMAVIDLARGGIAVEGIVPDFTNIALIPEVEAWLVERGSAHSIENFSIGGVRLARDPWKSDMGTGMAFQIVQPDVDWLRVVPQTS